MDSRKWHCLIAIASSVVLSSCAGAVVVTSQYVDQSYSSAQLGFATKNGEQIPVIINGDPFNTDPDTLNDAVLAAMNGSNFGPVVEFAVDPKTPATQDSRVVMAFNPRGPVDVNTFCTSAPQTEGTTGNTVRIAAAYCEGTYTLTSANVRADDVEGPQSAKFNDMTVQLTQALFPPFNPNFPNGGNDSCIDC